MDLNLLFTVNKMYNSVLTLYYDIMDLNVLFTMNKIYNLVFSGKEMLPETKYINSL